MLYALERTPCALRLLALEKTTQGLQVQHYDQRLFTHQTRLGAAPNEGSVIQSLQEMRRGITGDCTLIMGIDDADLVICRMTVAQDNLKNLYQYCQIQLGQSLSYPLSDYSWDVQILTNNAVLCVAYPLQKIYFLQEICALCDMNLHVIEPSVCALARAIAQLLHYPVALFLLFENNIYTFCLSVNGHIFALKRLQDAQLLAQQYHEWLQDDFLSTYMQQVETIFLQEAQDLSALSAIKPLQEQRLRSSSVLQINTQTRLADNAQFLTCAGLLLRQEAS